MGSKTGKSRRPRIDQVMKLANTILPPEQCRVGTLAIRDIANYSDADQRKMVRSGESRTVRKLTRVERLWKAEVITIDQLQACEWYAKAHELGFGTVGCTTNYETAGGGLVATDLLSRYKAQSEAREDYYYARSAIPDHLLWLFEAVVLETGLPPPNLNRENKTRFSLAAFLLHGQIGHVLLIAA